MENDYDQMFNNLSVLLQDICQFLNNDKLGSLSHRDKKIVESLIMRSKVQLQEIAKIQKNSICEEYVDMDAKKVSASEEDEEKIDIYSSVDDDINKKNMDTIVQDEPLCPYNDLPAREASQIVKYGFMYMRRRFLLGFEKMKRVYGAVHNKWLLIYYTEKDLKPICTFNLKNYEAKESDGSKSINFELISTLNRKVYYFMALTPKDLSQWVININRCFNNIAIKNKDLEKNDLSLEEDVEEHYDRVVLAPQKNKEELEEDDDDIYLELDDIVDISRNNNTVSQKSKDFDFGPPLPKRRPQKEELPIASPLDKSLNSSHSSTESLASYDDISELKKSAEQISEDDEDAIYEAYVHVKQKHTNKSNLLPPENEGIHKTITQSETNTILIIKQEDIEPKNEIAVVNLKEKIEKHYITTNKDGARMDSEKIPKLNTKSINLFLQESIKKPNSLLNISPDVNLKPDVDKKITICESASSGSKQFKGSIGLSPPVIKKVPTVPLKPKIRDKPSISKRPPFSSFRQINNEH